MSTRRTRGTDRVVTVVLGAVLLAVGLAAWDWRLGLTGGLASTLDVSATDPVLDSAWWPWAWAVRAAAWVWSASRGSAAPGARPTSRRTPAGAHGSVRFPLV